MNIIEAQDVDIIAPFPVGEIKRLVGWMHCYKSIITADGFPQTPEDMEAYFQAILPSMYTWGVIDRNNTLKSKHEAPLIGYIAFEPSGPHNGYFHVASTRKAWGSRLIDQAGDELVKQLFTSQPSLLRVSAAILDTNFPAKGLARRLGFTQDGLMKDMITQDGTPKAIAHFGLLRSKACPVS